MDWQKRYGKQGLVVLAFSQAPIEVQKNFAEGMNINYPLLLWEAEKLPPPLDLVIGTPTNLLIDRQRRLRLVMLGPLFMSPKVEEELLAALKEKSLSAAPSR